MAAVDAVVGDWPAALACVREARDAVQRAMAASACAAARTYARAVKEWVDSLPEVGGTSESLQQPQDVRTAGSKLPLTQLQSPRETLTPRTAGTRIPDQRMSMR